jgi:glycosyltransferase involved in cell wall biosynthesis
LISQSKGKTKVLFVSTSLLSFSGFSNIATNLMLRMKRTGNYDISYYSLSGQIVDNVDMKLNLEIFGKEFANEFKDLEYHNGQLQFEETFNNFDSAVEKVRPDIVICISDIWLIESVIFSCYKNSFFLILYFTCEVPHYPKYAMSPTMYDSTLRKSLKNLFRRCDLIIPVSNMGKNALKEMGIVDNVSENVYNGIDINRHSVTKKTKQEVFSKQVINNDDFLFMSVSENTDRKLLDRTIMIFHKFLQEIENPEKYRLYLHTNFQDSKGGTDLVSLILDLGIKDRIILSASFRDGKFMATEDLYDRYKVSDCYLSFTGGEGMGLGCCEAMMHKVPVIYHNYGAPSEYVKDIGLPVKTQTYIYAKNIAVKFGLADIDEAVEKMKYIVQNENIRQQMSDNGFLFAQKNLDWNVVFPKFLKIVEDNYSKFKKSNVLLKQIMINRTIDAID